MKYSAHNQVFNKIIKNKRGKLFFPTDFLVFGGADAIRSSLHRLERDHVLERLAHGIYLYPKIDPVVGSLYPSTEEKVRLRNLHNYKQESGNGQIQY